MSVFVKLFDFSSLNSKANFSFFSYWQNGRMHCLCPKIWTKECKYYARLPLVSLFGTTPHVFCCCCCSFMMFFSFTQVDLKCLYIFAHSKFGWLFRNGCHYPDNFCVHFSVGRAIKFKINTNVYITKFFFVSLWTNTIFTGFENPKIKR